MSCPKPCSYGVKSSLNNPPFLMLAAQAASKAVAPKLYFEFPIGFDEALEYKKAHGQYLRRNQWQDLTVQFYI